MNKAVKRKRSYRLKKRALRQDETRQRIVEATVHLHHTLGPAHTTVMGIAAAAGVERPTVYRYFPDGDALFQACTARSLELWPAPKVANWIAVADPSVRLQVALGELYAYYASRGEGLAVIFRDEYMFPEWLRERLATQRTDMLDALLRGRRGRAGRTLRAALSHAIRYQTYHSLVVEQGLKIPEAVQLMVKMVRIASE